MVVSLGPQGTLVTGTKAKPVTVAQYRRRLLCTCVSTILTNWDASISRASQYIYIGFVTGIRQRQLPQLVTGHVKWLFSGPTGNFGNGYQGKARYSSSISETPAVHLRLHYLDELRHVYFTRVSAHIRFVTGIKQWPLPQLVTGHVKCLFLWAHRELWQWAWNRGRYCEINIRDAFCEPASPLSWWNETYLFLRASVFSLLKETLAFNLCLIYLDEQARSCGPPARTGKGLLHCLLHYGHVCNELSEWSPLVTNQCL
jgi:hypothetical protein